MNVIRILWALKNVFQFFFWLPQVTLFPTTNADNIVISKFVKTKTNSKYLIGYLDKAIRPLFLIIPKMSGYIKTFKAEEKINKLMSFCIDDEKLLSYLD